MRLLIIFNPKAAHGRSAKKLAAIKARLSELGIEAVIKATRYSGHGSKIVASTELAPFDGVIAAGGDGTIFEVLNGLYQHPAKQRVPLGVIPIGTGNAFARDLELQPSDWWAAIELIHQAYTRPLDVGHVTTAIDEFYFLNIINLGFAVDANLSAMGLKFIGNAAYTVASLWQTLKLKSYALSLELDGDVWQQDNIFVSISNTRYTGTHFLMAPDALLDDGLLDVTMLENLPRLRLLKLFPTIYSGGHVKYPEVSVLQAADIIIHSPAGMLLSPDGEIRGKTPARITCLQQDLEVFSPAPQTD